jgi:hypothetical protein
MNKIILTFFCCAFLGTITLAQEAKPKKKTKIELGERTGDHLMLQFGYDGLTGMPDSINDHKSGLSKGFNAYLMFDKPFRSSPKLSIAFGIGIGTDNISFKKMNVDLKSNTTTYLPFIALDSSDHFKKYKLSYSYVEVPLEFRFSSDPVHNSKSVKVALGAKIGTIINAHTKGRTLQDRNNVTINNFTDKENSRKFFNSSRITGTARIGYGIFSIYGNYQFTTVFKDGVSAPMKAFEIGLCLSGL